MASISVVKDNLYLLANLPDKQVPNVRRRQRIPLKMKDSPANQRVAKRRLEELERQLREGSFDWSFWVEDSGKTVTWREAIRRLHEKKCVLGRTGESTWQTNYMGRLRQIDPASRCTTASMKAALERYERDSCSYQTLYYLLKNIAELVHQPMPKVPLPTYRQAALVEVPSDDEIVAWVKAARPSQRWYLGMMATYGLRPHEIEGSELIAEGRIQVPDGTKTGFRTVIPLHREWFDLFNLGNPKPRERTRPSRSADSNDAVAQWLWRHSRQDLGLPWRPYALRHAYAARLWRMGGSRLDLYTAARLMGHSVAQHEKTYRAHIQPHTIADDAERALAAHARILNGGIG